MSGFRDFVRALPKAELHLHIEGTLEPEMLMALAGRHGAELPYASVEEVRRAYDFSDLQSFLDIYYLGAQVLVDEQDFHDLMHAYLLRCRDENIVHAEIMFDPQTHTDRGVGFEVFMPGFLSAMDAAEREWGQSSSLIMCFLRHLPEESAHATLAAAEPFRDRILAVGLDSSELGHPPEKFARAFKDAGERGYRRVAHAGEEGPPAYIADACTLLGAERIDHGVRCMEDDALVDRLVDAGTPLTVCPLSNVRLRVFEGMAQHPVRRMLERGLNVTVNSDDPPYFGGYLLDNFDAIHEALGIGEREAVELARNSIRGSFAADDRKAAWLAELDGAPGGP